MKKKYSIQFSFEFATHRKKNPIPFSYPSFNNSFLEQKLDPKGVNSVGETKNLNFPPKTVNNLFKFSAQDSDLEYLFWRFDTLHFLKRSYL